MSERVGRKCPVCGGLGEVFVKDTVLLRDKLVKCEACLDGFTAKAEDYIDKDLERERAHEREWEALNDQGRKIY